MGTRERLLSEKKGLPEPGWLSAWVEGFPQISSSAPLWEGCSYASGAWTQNGLRDMWCAQDPRPITHVTTGCPVFPARELDRPSRSAVRVGQGWAAQLTVETPQGLSSRQSPVRETGRCCTDQPGTCCSWPSVYFLVTRVGLLCVCLAPGVLGPLVEGGEVPSGSCPGVALPTGAGAPRGLVCPSSLVTLSVALSPPTCRPESQDTLSAELEGFVESFIIMGNSQSGEEGAHHFLQPDKIKTTK